MRLQCSVGTEFAFENPPEVGAAPPDNRACADGSQLLMSLWLLPQLSWIEHLPSNPKWGFQKSLPFFHH